MDTKNFGLQVIPPFTVEDKLIFLNELAKFGNVSLALRTVKISSNVAYRHREEDLQFAIEWRKAEIIGHQALEDEAYRRGLQGYEKKTTKRVQAVIDGVPFGPIEETTTVVHEYSDALLQILLRGNIKKYNNDSKIEVNGTVEHRHILDLSREKLMQIASSKAIDDKTE